jgi:hypothetical protein
MAVAKPGDLEQAQLHQRVDCSVSSRWYSAPTIRNLVTEAALECDVYRERNGLPRDRRYWVSDSSPTKTAMNFLLPYARLELLIRTMLTRSWARDA